MTDTPKESTASAIEARRQQVAGFQRPQVLSDVNIREAVAEVRDTADLFKVYMPEWLVVFSSTAIGPEGRLEAEAFFTQKYGERVFDHDVKYEPASPAMPDEFGTRLLLRLPNVRGEFKTHRLAEEFIVNENYEGAQIVARNSRDEYQLREYSTKKLTSAQIAAGK